MTPGPLPTLPRNGVRSIRGADLHTLYASLALSTKLSPIAHPFAPGTNVSGFSSTGGWGFSGSKDAGADQPPPPSDKAEPEAPPDPRQVAAARKIQTWLRRRLLLLAARSTPTPRQSAFRSALAEFTKAAAALPATLDGIGLRRKILLGPICDASFAIVESHKLVMARKKKLQKKDLPNVKHLELEAVMTLIGKTA